MVRGAVRITLGDSLICILRLLDHFSHHGRRLEYKSQITNLG